MRRTTLTFALGAFAFTHAAVADIHNLTATLDGLQEVPSVATPGAGFANMILDDVTNAFTLTGSFANLIGTSSAAHVHGAAPVGVNAGVLFGITVDLGVTSGNFSFNGVLTAAQKQTILDGFAYINIHSTFRPGGEIRGQIVPAPSALGALGLGGLLAFRRRR